MTGSSEVYERMLKLGREKRVCTACTRNLNDHELVVFDKHVSDVSSPVNLLISLIL